MIDTHNAIVTFTVTGDSCDIEDCTFNLHSIALLESGGRVPSYSIFNELRNSTCPISRADYSRKPQRAGIKILFSLISRIR